MPTSLKRILVGQPKQTAQLSHERLSNPVALAVFSSDALSSVAYATEEILLVLALLGSSALSLSFPVAAAIGLLLIIVTFSYRQTIHAYPSGGGAYIVTKDNLGVTASLVAGSALLIDYVLTVAVSVAAGAAAITSAVPSLYPYRVLLGITVVGVITLANLRGIRESGRLFALPTYLFILSLFTLILMGLGRALVGETPPAPPLPPAAASAVPLFLILRAFAAGCTALTGIEAISDGVPAFKPPESRNAAATLTWMAATLLTLFLGITLLSWQLGILPREGETVVSQLARSVFGTSLLYYLTQAATALILILAANTSFADFPRLSSFLARDRFLPHQLLTRGDRLVFSNGILLLGLFASLLLILFQGETHAIIPLYAVGVFISFTLSQAGMVRHWITRRGSGWVTSTLINGTGAATTGLVLTVIAGTKFLHGAWAVILLIPVFMGIFQMIHAHYRHVGEQLALHQFDLPKAAAPIALVLVSDVHRGVLTALRYARAIFPRVEAVTVNLDEAAVEKLTLRWGLWSGGVPLTVLESPYRSLLHPLSEYIETVRKREGADFVTLILPEFIPARWWQHLLHNQTALWIKAAFLFHKGTIVVSVPSHLER